MFNTLNICQIFVSTLKSATRYFQCPSAEKCFISLPSWRSTIADSCYKRGKANIIANARSLFCFFRNEMAQRQRTDREHESTLNNCLLVICLIFLITCVHCSCVPRRGGGLQGSLHCRLFSSFGGKHLGSSRLAAVWWHHGEADSGQRHVELSATACSLPLVLPTCWHSG